MPLENMDGYEGQRQNLVENYIKPVGILDDLILEAFNSVPRHLFVPERFLNEAYYDMPLPIGEGQTISQPSLVALMTQLLQLKSTDRVLEVGTGTGYQVSIISRIAKSVYSIERIQSLAEKAKEIIKSLGYGNIHIIVGDGTKGLAEKAPFDAIVVTAAADQIPRALIEQLKEKGRLVIPVGEHFGSQMLKLGTKQKGEMVWQNVEPVAFVPLVEG